MPQPDSVLRYHRSLWSDEYAVACAGVLPTRTTAHADSTADRQAFLNDSRLMVPSPWLSGGDPSGGRGSAGAECDEPGARRDGSGYRRDESGGRCDGSEGGVDRSAVDDEVLPDDEPGVGAAQERAGLAEFLRRAEAP